jgi:hypothetical protein
MLRVVVVLWLAGCGRIAFDPFADARDGSTPAQDAGSIDGTVPRDATSLADALDPPEAGPRDSAIRFDGGSGPCASPGVIFCDAFEGGYRPEWFEDSPGALSVVADPTGEPDDVLKVWLDGSGASRLIYAIEPPYLGGSDLYVQFRVLLQSPAPVASTITLLKTTTGTEALAVHVDPNDTTALSGSFGASTTDVPGSFPRGDWTCVTLRILVTYSDGLMDLTVGPRLLQLEPVTTRFAEGYTELSLGLIGVDSAQTVYFDDFSFGTSVPPCD